MQHQWEEPGTFPGDLYGASSSGPWSGTSRRSGKKCHKGEPESTSWGETVSGRNAWHPFFVLFVCLFVCFFVFLCLKNHLKDWMFLFVPQNRSASRGLRKNRLCTSAARLLSWTCTWLHPTTITFIHNVHIWDWRSFVDYFQPHDWHVTETGIAFFVCNNAIAFRHTVKINKTEAGGMSSIVESTCQVVQCCFLRWMQVILPVGCHPSGQNGWGAWVEGYWLVLEPFEALNHDFWEWESDSLSSFHVLVGKQLGNQRGLPAEVSSCSCAHLPMGLTFGLAWQNLKIQVERSESTDK